MFGRRLTDAQVVRRVLGGDRGAFRELVERYGGIVYGVAFAHLGNAADAEDVGQDTFLRAFERLDTLRDARSVGGWLATVARNRCRDLLRRRKHEQALTEKLGPEGPELPRPDREEMRRLVWAHLQELDEQTREILVLHYFYGRRVAELAQALDISRAAAAKRLQRAREALGERLGEALGPDLTPEEAPKARVERIMGLVLVAKAPWEGSAAAVGAGSAGMGAVAAKVAVGGVLAGALALTGWFFWPEPASLGENAAASPPLRPAQAVAEATKAARAESAGVEAAADEGLKDYPADARVARSGIVRGFVVSEDGEPVAGVPVVLEHDSWGLYGAPGHTWFRTTTTSDASGAFRFERVPVRLHWSPGFGSPRRPATHVPGSNRGISETKLNYFYKLTARHHGRYAYAVFKSGPVSSEWFAELTLSPADPIEGVVVDEAGNGIAGASIREQFGSRSTTHGQWERNDGTTAYADASGRFRIDWFQPGRYSLTVDAPEFGSATTAPIATGTRDVRVVLSRGVTVEGAVVDARTGAPVEGVPVRLDHTSLVYDPAKMVSVSDERGRFRLAGLPPGSHSLGVHEGPWVLVGEQPVAVSQGGSDPALVRVPVARGGSIAGRVYDAATGEGVEGIEVYASNPKARSQRRVPTDADGQYRLEGLEEGEVSLHMSWTGSDYFRFEPPTVAMSLGQAVEGVDIPLDRSRRIAGRVVDERGAPVPHAWVLGAFSAESNDFFVPASTDPEGNFCFVLPVDSAFATLQAMAGGRLSEKAGPTRFARDGLRGVELVARPAGSIEGSVVDASGRPVRRARVVVRPSSPALAPVAWNGQEPDELNDAQGASAYWGGLLKAETGVGGRFRIGPLLPGAYAVEVATEEARQPKTARAPVLVEEGRDTTGLRLAVGSLGGGAVEGTVTCGGAPVASVLVFAHNRETGAGASDRTGADGRYRIQGVPAGSVLLTVYHVDGESGRTVQRDLRRHGVPVADGHTTPLDVELAPSTAWVEGRVLLGTEPVAKAYVSVRPTGSEIEGEEEDVGPGLTFSTTTDAQGYYRITGLPAGQCYLWGHHYPRVGNTTVVPKVVPLDVRDGDRLTVDLQFGLTILEGRVAGAPEDETVYGKVVPGEVDVSNVTPEYFDTDLPEMLANRFSLGATREFRVDGLKPGRYTVVAVAGNPPDNRRDLPYPLVGHATVELVEGQTSSVEVALP